MWYVVLQTLEEPQLPLQHQHPAGEDATVWALFAARELVRVWQQRRKLQVVFGTP